MTRRMVIAVAARGMVLAACAGAKNAERPDERSPPARTQIGREAQCRHAVAGLAELADRYGENPTDDTPESWRILMQFVSTDRQTWSMDAAQGATTPVRAQGLPVPAGV